MTNFDFDKQHIWHPYSAIGADLPVFHVESAKGCKICLKDGRELIDGMASWWSVIHGYRNPIIDSAVKAQMDKMSHVMFGGLTHDPAIELAKKLVDFTAPELDAVFFADSGSVSVEVAMKMAMQYWASQGKGKKQKFVSLRSGYHGDTLGAMSVCDPVTGMHSLFKDALAQQHFVPAPQTPFGAELIDDDLMAMEETLTNHSHEIAAVIVEPIVQGAGGMRFYSADYLNRVRELTDQNNVLLIFDEIATGFGRTGKLFAYEHTDIIPDILCLGKAITGGYMTLAATIATRQVAETIQQGEPGVFMHGPTFMANPLACSAANASLGILQSGEWQVKVRNIESKLKQHLNQCSNLNNVAEVRVLGAIGVVEMKEPVVMSQIQPMFVEHGVWVRPFGKLVYVMPPYIMSEEELKTLCTAIYQVLEKIARSSI